MLDYCRQNRRRLQVPLLRLSFSYLWFLLGPPAKLVTRGCVVRPGTGAVGPGRKDENLEQMWWPCCWIRVWHLAASSPPQHGSEWVPRSRTAWAAINKSRHQEERPSLILLWHHIQQPFQRVTLSHPGMLRLCGGFPCHYKQHFSSSPDCCTEQLLFLTFIPFPFKSGNVVKHIPKSLYTFIYFLVLI